MPFKIRWVCTFLCESSEMIHTKYLGLLAAEMLFKCLLNIQRLVAYATKIVQGDKIALLWHWIEQFIHYVIQIH